MGTSTSSQPLAASAGGEIQQFGTVRQLPLALSFEVRLYSTQRLNRILADTQIMHSLYKKYHWLMRGRPFTSSTCYSTSTRASRRS